VLAGDNPPARPAGARSGGCVPADTPPSYRVRH
jgi:hypothetical protein